MSSRRRNGDGHVSSNVSEDGNSRAGGKRRRVHENERGGQTSRERTKFSSSGRHSTRQMGRTNNQSAVDGDTFGGTSVQLETEQLLAGCSRQRERKEEANMEHVHSRNKSESSSSSCGMGSEPSISDFFNFTSTPQVNAPLPNAMKSNIKHKPVTRPQAAPYHSDYPEEKRKYVGEDGDKIKTIQVPEKESDEDSDSSLDDSNKETKLETGRRFSRYFKKDDSVYSKYSFDEQPKIDTTRLAVFDKKTHILNSVNKARVVIVEGFTGCGKTTQIPQYILDQCYKDQRVCNIVVTQPRKLAAISVAGRVCKERNWELGSVVGFQVGMENKTDGKDTLLTFVTTGVLLQKLIGSKSLKEYTHIIIDEVHERDLDTDFLLLVIKKLMQADKEQKETHVKLILMSATIDTKKFENYFIFQKADGEQIRPHVIKIPFVARHKVQEVYLEDLFKTKKDQLDIIISNMDIAKATTQQEIYDAAVSCIVGLDDIERKENRDPRMRRKLDNDYPKDRGAVLVFLPGIEDIRRLERALEKEESRKLRELNNRSRNQRVYYKWAVVILHSSVGKDQQNSVNHPAGDKFRKIILSTNMAESSLTVPDVKYVIDFCMSKSKYIDKTTNFSTLQMCWAAKSQCIQRKGRAGRVADGIVYRLVPKDFFAQLADNIIPEMQRSSLETVVLLCKKIDLDSPTGLLRDCLDRPEYSDIQRAVASLKELGALTVEMLDKKTGRTTYDTADGDFTFVGKVMADLPISQQCTRLILLGHCFGVMHETIIIAAGLSVKSIFNSKHSPLETYLTKMKHAKKSFSDLFALYHVYNFWNKTYNESRGTYGERKPPVNEYKWAADAMVDSQSLKEIKSTVELLEKRLKRLGITCSYTIPDDPRKNEDPNNTELSSERGMFLKLAIAGAFYPCYFLRRRPDQAQYERDIEKVISRNDPFRTVYFTGFPTGHEGQLYAKHVANYLSCNLSIPVIRFEGSKVLAIFDNSTGNTIGPFNEGMFKAIKKRKLREEQLEFRILGKENERGALNSWNAQVQNRQTIKCPRLTGLPPVNISSVRVHVQHIISPSQFWVIHELDFVRLDNLTKLIDRHISPILLPSNKLYPNALCLAPFDGVYYRAKILQADNSNRADAKSFVYFVDYGNSEWVNSSYLYDFSPHHMKWGVAQKPCMAIECRLQELMPNRVYDLHWSQQSINFMKMFCKEMENFELKIHSISHSIIAGELIGINKDSQQFSLNHKLLNGEKRFGQKIPELRQSMENYNARQRARMMGTAEIDAAGIEQLGDSLNLDFIEPPPNGRTTITLKGPRSPLEISFEGLVQCSVTKTVQPEMSSVNSILLDHEPTSSNSRLLVGAQVSVANRSQSCIINDSTVMPAIPGILPLVAMMFATRAELRVDKAHSKYIGVLCGCGTIGSSTSNTNDVHPVHPDNDMEIVFDTEIDEQDISMINTIRYQLNLILRNNPGVNKSGYFKGLREGVIKLLQKQRKVLTEEFTEEEHVWNRVSSELLHLSIDSEMSFHHDDIFQPHRQVLLNPVEEQVIRWDGGY